MSFTFDLLKQNEILTMHDRQQQPINKLTSLEQFYTNVSMVYDKQQQEEEKEKEKEDEDEDEDEDDEEEEEEKEKEKEIFVTIIDNLDKARYQLDEMCAVIDMLSKNTNNNNNELLYKLSRPLTYEIMHRQHFCAISRQKTDQFSKSLDIFQNGMVSINKSIEKGRRFSKNLVYLSKYWRLTTLNILKNDNYLNIPNGSNNNVFIDYRLQRKENNINGLLPLLKTHKTGNIQIDVNDNHNNENNKWQSPEKKVEKKQENIIGFDDDDSEEDDTEKEEEEYSWHRICEYVYESQINLLYFELFNMLRMEVCDWNPKYYNGIICKLQSNGICIHTPSANDFVVKFIVSNDDNNDLKQEKKWNKFIICGDEENMDKKICSDIEQKVIKMLIAKIKGNNSEKNNNKFTLNGLKNEELKYLKNLSGGNIFSLNNLIGKFEGNEENDNNENVNKNDNNYNDNNDKIVIKENKCELLEYIITKINHHRLSKKVKKLLLQFSKQNKTFNIKWNQLNSKNIVNVVIEKREKLLLNITLNGLKITVIKYFNHLKKTNYLKQAQVSKLIPVFNVHQLQKILSSFN